LDWVRIDRTKYTHPDFQGESTDAPLVIRRISPRNRRKFVEWLDIFSRDTVLRKGVSGYSSVRAGGGDRGEINSFSWASKRRLKFQAGNAFPKLVSQYCLTYHKFDGITSAQVSKHLKAFLQQLRRRKMPYLWIKEFQKRGVPHYHVFLTEEVCPYLGRYLAKAWNRITGESSEHLAVHSHPRNFIAWEMGAGGYLCKYLGKDQQKQIPEGYGSGRFWGCSRGIVPEPEKVDLAEVDKCSSVSVNPETGEVETFKAREFLLRSLRRYHKSVLRLVGSASQRSKNVLRYSARIPNGSVVTRQLLGYCQAQMVPF